jgi:hypothetical protein
MNAFVGSPKDVEALASLRAITEGVVDHSSLARQLGVDQTALGRWWSGDRGAWPALLAVGRRVRTGSQAEAARWVETIGHAIGLPGFWTVTGRGSPASIQTVLHLASAAGDAARLLGDGQIDPEERDDARRIAALLREIATQLEAEPTRRAA